jgi:hypothetical protein
MEKNNSFTRAFMRRGVSCKWCNGTQCSYLCLSGEWRQNFKFQWLLSGRVIREYPVLIGKILYFFKPLKRNKHNLLSKFISYRAVNIFFIGSKNQSVNSVQGKNCCFFSEITQGTTRNFGMLNLVVDGVNVWPWRVKFGLTNAPLLRR